MPKFVGTFQPRLLFAMAPIKPRLMSWHRNVPYMQLV